MDAPEEVPDGPARKWPNNVDCNLKLQSAICVGNICRRQIRLGLHTIVYGGKLMSLDI